MAVGASIAAAARPRWLAAALWTLAVASALIGLYGLSYVVGRPAPPGPDTNTFVRPRLVIHAISAGTAILIGPWQFVASTPWRRAPLHRWVGRAYLTLCAVGGTSGLLLATGSSAGDVARWGFGLLAAAWLAANAMGYRAALARDFQAHRRWMIRSFALTFAAVTLRLYLPLATVAAGLSFQLAYPAIAWACWVPNLIVAELWIRTHPRSPRIA
jgi:hypothetical protein